MQPAAWAGQRSQILGCIFCLCGSPSFDSSSFLPFLAVPFPPFLAWESSPAPIREEHVHHRGRQRHAARPSRRGMLPLPRPSCSTFPRLRPRPFRRRVQQLGPPRARAVQYILSLVFFPNQSSQRCRPDVLWLWDSSFWPSGSVAPSLPPFFPFHKLRSSWRLQACLLKAWPRVASLA